MLNLSHNRLSSIVGLSSLPALIALNLGKSIPAFCHLLRSRDLEADATLTASLLMKVAAGLVVLCLMISVSFLFPIDNSGDENNAR